MQWQNASSCRTCLQEYNKVDAAAMISIFKEESWENGVQQDLQECLGVELQNHVRLPSRICPKCVEALDKALSFRRMCLGSQAKLLEVVTKVEIHIPEAAIYDDETSCLSVEQLCDEFIEFSEKPVSTEEFNSIPDKRTCSKSDLKTQKNAEILLKTDSKSPEPKKTKIPNGKSTAGGSAAVQIMCEICGNIYNKRSLLNLHMRRHLQLKTFECELCDKAFVAKMEMHRHMRVHTGARPFKCKYCTRAFGDVSTVKKHERTHTKERPFVCQTCGKDFAYSHVLKDHMLTHTGEKRFSCKPCNKTFARIHLLKQHMGTLTHKQTASAAGEL